MSSATLPQAQRILELAAEKRVSCEQLQEALRSGVFADVFDEKVQWKEVNRFDVRVVLGLEKRWDCPHFEKWITLNLLTFPRLPSVTTFVYFLKMLKGEPVVLDPISEAMIKSSAFDFSEDREVDLVLVTPAMLGFKQDIYYEMAFERVLQFGLEPCTAEVGLKLTLASKDFSVEAQGVLVDKGVMIGMKPIVCGSHPYVFRLTKESGYLHLRYRSIASCDRTNLLRLDKLIAFVLPRR